MSAQFSEVIAIEELDGFMRVGVSAGATFRSLLHGIDTIAAGMHGRDAVRVLIDLSRVTPPGPVEQAILGEHVARQLSRAERIASLVATGTKTGISGRVAQGLGLQLQTFTSEAEAVQWLRA